MNKTEQNRILSWRLKVLREASVMPRNVAQTCRRFGLSRKSFYKWRARHRAYGEAGLCDVPESRCTPRERRLVRLFQRSCTCGSATTLGPEGSQITCNGFIS